ncbi:MAG: phosphatidate cytidylyltransferase [Planctomycetota bacterium]|nr:phosphatidate cytidylyltransferase [Planctomycetota bacterium]
MADSVKVRTAIGACLIAAIVGLLTLDNWTGHGWGVIILCTALTAAGLREFALMASVVGPIPRRSLVVAGAAYTALKGLGYEVDPRLHLLLAPLAVGYAYAVFFACLRGAPSLERLQGLAATALGFFYIPFLGGYALEARFADPSVGQAAFFYVVAIAKGTDICAYFTGKALGRTKVVPSVSPGKTQAGFVGAVVGAALITCAFSAWSSLGTVIPLPLAPGVGIVMSLVVISGDLIESFMKRSAAVKDSAKLLPGYGGVLDVVDSVVIAAPVVVWTLALLRRMAPLG